MCNCSNNNKVQPASITPVIALGSTASPYFVQVNISQKLCFQTCVNETPVFNPRFNLVSVANVGTNQFMATIHVEGIISYIPCNGGCACAKQQPLSQNFTIPFTTEAPSPVVTISAGEATNTMAITGCRTCGKNFVSECPITITIA